MIPWGVIARILLRIGGAILLEQVVKALRGLGHHAPAPIAMEAGEVAALPDPEALYPEDEQDFALGCPRIDDLPYGLVGEDYDDYDAWGGE